MREVLGLFEGVLSAQTNSLGRGYAAAPITDWFNPSTAHKSFCSSEAVLKVTVARHAQYVPNGIDASGSRSRH